MKGFSIKTEIEEYDTFEQFAKEAQLGEKDLVLCGEHTYKQYVEPLSLGVQTLFREKYGKGEPTDGAVDAILDALRDKNFDRIVAIGGGTVIDIAKAVAVAAPEDKVDDLYDHVSELEKRHPLIIVPTTCGTGSEVTNISVMNRVSKGVKMGLASDAMLADKAVLITNLLDSMPYQVFATSSIDAMVHSAESFLSPNGCSISRLFSSEALKLILTCWDKVVKEQFEKRNPDLRVFQMTRAAYAGLQRYTFGWTGDCGNGDDVLQGWGQMANQIPVLLSAGLGVIPFVACDISGYCGDIEDYPAMAELYTRWVQLGAFNPLSRIHHEGDVAVEPWLFGEEAEKNVKAAIEMKYRLLPYIYTYAREAYETGLPIMRPMFMEYPADLETVSTDAQFMFGSELLVAPVVKKGATNKNVYLPEGTWIDYNDKRTEYSGEQWTTANAPLNTIPMFVRKGSIIPQMPVMNYTDEKAVYPITFEVFPAAAGDETSFSLYEDAGTDLGYQRGEFMRTPVSCRTTEKGYVLEIGERAGEKYALPGERNLMFCIYTGQMPKEALIDGQKVRKMKTEKLNEGMETEFKVTAWCPDKKQNLCMLRLPDDGLKHTIEFIY